MSKLLEWNNYVELIGNPDRLKQEARDFKLKFALSDQNIEFVPNKLN